MVEVSGNRQASALLALHVMQDLIKSNYTVTPSTTTAPTPDITDREHDILEYIAGYILTKLKSAPESNHFVSDESSGLIAAMDRGGLVKPTPDFVSLIKEMEVVFREMPDKSVDRQVFHSALTKTLISTNFLEYVSIVDTTAESKEQFYINIINLFFVIRAHQKCRYLVNRNVRENKKSRKTKALRDSV